MAAGQIAIPHAYSRRAAIRRALTHHHHRSGEQPQRSSRRQECVRDLIRSRSRVAVSLIALSLVGCSGAASGAHGGLVRTMGAPIVSADSAPTQAASTVVSVSALPRPSRVAPATRCPRSALTLSGPLPGYGGATGERELTFALHNNGRRICSLKGIPVVQLSGPGRMPYVYETIAGPYLSTAAPRNVTLASHGVAYFQVVKYRCDLGDGPVAS